jgi:basic membrane protein A
MKKIFAAIISIMMLGAILTGCTGKSNTTPSASPASSTEKKKDVKVGFIYIGQPGDMGYTYAHDQGRLYLEKELGVKTVKMENVPEDAAKVEKVCEDMISQGCNVIVGTSFGFLDGMKRSAKNHKEVTYLHASGTDTDTPNLSTYFGKIEQTRYLSGIVAGMKSKSGKIGYVAAFPIPECIRGINAFTLGVRSVNPSAVVKVVWTSTWFDPAKETEAANTLLSQGVDVITQHQDSAAAQQAAEKVGAFSIGYNSDMSKSAPKAYMTAPTWNWGPYYVRQVKAVQDGTWKKESYWGGLEDNIVDLAPLTALAPDGAQAKVDAAKADIKSGKLNVFAGPIKDQTGAEKVAKGATMKDEDVWNMTWFVEGVEGKIQN